MNIEAAASITYHETLVLPGGTRDWLTNLSPVWQQGKICYLVGSRTDITELKTLRKANEGMLASLQAMFTGHNAAMMMTFSLPRCLTPTKSQIKISRPITTAHTQPVPMGTTAFAAAAPL